MQKKRILIVDDDKSFNYVKRILSHFIYDLYFAKSISEVTNSLISYEIDLIIVNINNLTVNGPRLTLKLKRKYRLPLLIISPEKKHSSLPLIDNKRLFFLPIPLEKGEFNMMLNLIFY